VCKGRDFRQQTGTERLYLPLTALMRIIKKAVILHQYLQKQRDIGKKIGFVPTMGALHEGHTSLIAEIQNHSDISVCSIFVNPTQFNDSADYHKYPINITTDIRKLTDANTDVLFLPAVDEVYKNGTENLEVYDLGYLETVFEGKYRPGHFQGVSQVMTRLLDVVRPDALAMGQKDYQQCMVVQKIIKGLPYQIDFITAVTRREKSGLAMSSRNLRLSEQDREKAAEIYKTLLYIKDNLQPGDLHQLHETARKRLVHNGFKLDYIQVADAAELQPVEHWDGQKKLVAVAAVFLGDVRLIDNMLLHS
jgi:pantoate--beta-alanine ligase